MHWTTKHCSEKAEKEKAFDSEIEMHDPAHKMQLRTQSEVVLGVLLDFTAAFGLKKGVPLDGRDLGELNVLIAIKVVSADHPTRPGPTKSFRPSYRINLMTRVSDV